MGEKRAGKGGTTRIAGCDLGKASAKLVVANLAADGGLEDLHCETVVHEGDAARVFADWYRRERIADCAALGATGVHADELVSPVLAGLPVDACLERVLKTGFGFEGPLNLVNVGARGYAVLTRDADGRIQYLENNKCSSGTGETIIKIAGRFGLSVQEADRLAQAASQAIQITARCSVFTKSEMTHFGNQGRRADELFKGYFTSIASYVGALLSRARVDGPVYLVGGGARIGALVQALGEILGQEVIVPEQAQCLQAIGATALAADRLQSGGSQDPLPADPAGLIQIRERRFRVLTPAQDFAHRVTRLMAPPVQPGEKREPCVLGLDLGSTGSKAVLTSLRTGEIVHDAYDRTRGNPVQAALRLIGGLLRDVEPDVRAIGLTGSGREAAATVMRAAYPRFGDRILVINEIVAHATAAIRCDVDRGRSLTVVEIGGQDAKFIQVKGGQVVESDMNKACSAGTGSFLEEQAIFYGIEDIEQFTDIAQRATRPPDLGQMCTVFIAEAAVEAGNAGFAVADLFGGFQYSVIYNYLNRVMGQRIFADRVFFQGKPASGPSLAWTLAAVSGRDVVVPPNPGAMGAWGIGLCARDEFASRTLDRAGAFDLRSVLDARIVERTEFQCLDKKCATLCNVEKTTVEVGGTRQTVFAGGACPRYEISTASKPKLPLEAPSAFDEREALLEPYLRDKAGPHPIGLPLTGALHGHIPFLSTFLRGLGLGLRVLLPTSRSLTQGEERCYSYDACAPIKIAHGVASADIDALFIPKLLSLGDVDGGAGKTCPMEQALPEMLRSALQAQGQATTLYSPLLKLDGNLRSVALQDSLRDTVRAIRPALGPALGVAETRLAPALEAAAEAQQRFDRERIRIGQRTLQYARKQGLAVVVVCGQQHVIHDRLVNAGIPRILRENGVLALPMDCFSIPQGTPSLPRIFWTETSRALRSALAARSRGDVYPLLLTAFGCTPSSFGEQVFSALMEGYPHTVLESDGHGGAAGYVTRIQAFLHAVRQHDRRASEAPGARLRLLEPVQRYPLVDNGNSPRQIVLTLGDLAPMTSRVFQAFGIDSVPAAPSSPQTLAAGRRDCSGKECISYQMIWGAFRHTLEKSPPDRPTLLLEVTGQGACRNCMFSVKDQLSLQRMGLQDRVHIRHFGPEEQLGLLYAPRMWSALITWDLLNQLLAYHRPSETEDGEAERLYQQLFQEAGDILARPLPAGWRALPKSLRDGQDMLQFVDRACQQFARLADRARNRPDLRTVLLSGDAYVRCDEFTNDNLVRRLNQRGVRVLLEPLSLLSEYMAEMRSGELFDFPTDWVSNTVMRKGMARSRRKIYQRARRYHPWLSAIDIGAALTATRPILDRYPVGQAPITIASVMHHWQARSCDGAVIASPWGCPAALISESLLRHQRSIPILYLYADGTQIDERQLNGFAFRLQRLPPRSRTV